MYFGQAHILVTLQHFRLQLFIITQNYFHLFMSYKDSKVLKREAEDQFYADVSSVFHIKYPKSCNLTDLRGHKLYYSIIQFLLTLFTA